MMKGERVTKRKLLKLRKRKMTLPKMILQDARWQVKQAFVQWWGWCPRILLNLPPSPKATKSVKKTKAIRFKNQQKRWLYKLQMKKSVPTYYGCCVQFTGAGIGWGKNSARPESSRNLKKTHFFYWKRHPSTLPWCLVLVSLLASVMSLLVRWDTDLKHAKI